MNNNGEQQLDPGILLEAARENLHTQNAGLQDFISQLFSAASYLLAQHNKLLQRVAKPLLSAAGKQIANNEGMLQNVIQPILLSTQNQIAEHNIQLGQVAAQAATSAVRTTPSTSRAKALPSPRLVATSQTPSPLVPAATLASPLVGLPDDLLTSTTERTVYEDSAPPPVDGVDSSATDNANPDGVTNVIAIRPCDLQAILNALNRPRSYDPFVDMATGEDEDIADKLALYYGQDFRDFDNGDPVGSLTALLAQTTNSES